MCVLLGQQSGLTFKIILFLVVLIVHCGVVNLTPIEILNEIAKKKKIIDLSI